MIPNEIKETQDQVNRLLFYQVESLKDDYEDLEEKYYHLNLDFKEKNRLLEFLIRDFKKLSEEMKCLKIYLDNRKVELKSKLSESKDNSDDLSQNDHNQTQLDHQSILCYGTGDVEMTDLQSKDNEDSNGLLSSFQSLVHDYVQSLTDNKANRLDKFKEQVLKIESSDNDFQLIGLVDSLNGENLNDRIKNFVNYKHKLQEHLNKLKLQMKLERNRSEQLTQKSPIDLNNLSKVNVEKLNLNKLEDGDEDRNLNKNLLELKYTLLNVEEDLNKLRRVQTNLDKEIARYLNEKETVETNIDSLRNDERKLLRELRDAQARIQELTGNSIHNQKIMEQLKRRFNE